MFWMNVGIVWIILQLLSNRLLYAKSRINKDSSSNIILGQLIGLGIEAFIIVQLFIVVNN